MKKQDTYVVDTILAWKIVNMSSEWSDALVGQDLKLPKTNRDKEIDFKIGPEITSFPILKERNKILSNYPVKPARYFYSEIYKPEIITQHPKILSCKSASAAILLFGKTIELKSTLQYKHYQDLT